MKKKVLVSIVILLTTVWAILGVYFVIYKFDVKEIAEEVIKEQKKEEPIVSTVSFLAVGDALIHGAVYNAAKSGNTYDFKPMFNLIKDDVLKFDIAFYNQETILGGSELGLSTYPRFNTPQEYGDDMLSIGFNLVARSNNHTLDRGEKAVLNAEEYWSSKKDVLTAGSYISFEAKEEARIFEKNGIKYTLLSYTYGTNGIPIPKGKEYMVDLYSRELATKDINRVKDEVDILIVSMHWGNEYTHNPTTFQKEEAKFLADLGVNIIVGHHPHVIQPVEYVDDTLVIYSMGNFISAQVGLNRKIGLMVTLDITKTEFKGETTIEYNNVLGTLLYNPNSSKLGKYVIYPFNKLNNSILANYESVFNQYSKYVKVDDSIEIKGL